MRQKAVAPLGLLSIATYLSANGHYAKIYDRDLSRRVSIKKVIKDFKPDIIGISAHSIKSYKDAIKVSKLTMKLKIPTVWGGAQPSLAPHEILNDGFADFVSIGEGELTWLDLVNTLESNSKSLHEIDGLAFIEEGKVNVNKSRDFADLSKLPMIDWSYIDPSKYFWENYIECDKMLYLYASKGCFGSCTFCFNKAFHKSTWRGRPPEHFLGEIKYLIENYGMDGVYFGDELFCIDRDRMHTVCHAIMDMELKFTWGCDARIGQFNKDDLQLMYNSGCRWLFYGIESGSEETQTRIKKGISLACAIDTFNNCKEIGIYTWASIIIGFPEETEEHLKETTKFVKKLNANLCHIQYFMPCPGAELYDYVVKNNLFTQPKTAREWTKFKLFDTIKPNMSKIPTRDLKVVRSVFLWESFFQNFSNSRHSKVFVFKSINHVVFNLFHGGFFEGIIGMFSAMKEFIIIGWNANLYPKIRKKYEL